MDLDFYVKFCLELRWDFFPKIELILGDMTESDLRNLLLSLIN